MSKLRGGKWRSDGPTRTNTGSSIRGKTISNPIPFTDDEEFPFRSPGTGIATPLGTEGIDKQLQLRASALANPTSAAQQDSRLPLAEPIATETSANTPPQHAYEAPALPTAQSPPLRVSAASTPSVHSEDKPKRKKSSLRAVFGRIFGKKQKNGQSLSLQARGSSDIRAHRSDPTALSRSPKGTGLSQQRSASLPINEFNRALRSHSTATEDFPLTEASYTNRESLPVDGQTKPRRATTPSRLWTPSRAPGYGDWTGLSPRPASSHARGSHVITGEEPEAIVGIALSHPNRKSRSLGELREPQVTNSVLTRRRSDEIKYWRESYDPAVLSPMSSNKAEAEEPILVDEADTAQAKEYEEPPQPFSFGPMGEMAGMKITQAASLETRVLSLEARMREMEKVVFRTRNPTPAAQLVLRDPPNIGFRREHSSSLPRPRTNESELSLPKQLHSRDNHQKAQNFSGPIAYGSQKRSSSYGSSRPSTVSINNSYHPSFEHVSHAETVDSAEQGPLTSSQTTARPLSTSTTIRGIPSSSPTMPKDGILTFEHYTALTNMISAEQVARQNLEIVVLDLQQRLQTLASASHAPPNLDFVDPLSDGTVGGGESSSFEQDDSSDDEGRYAGEDFQTPNEESGLFGDEIFGDMSASTGDYKSAPRTLSLSQMTLKKGAQASTNF